MTVKTPAELKTLYESISFDLQTTYTGPLGQEYAVSGTHLRLWAPTAQRVEVSLYRKGSGGEPIGTLPLERGQQGVWSIYLPGDQHGRYYTYTVTVDGISRQTGDPYARAAGVNGTRSMIVDLARTAPSGWERDVRPVIPPEQRAVWEVSVRDFSQDAASGVRPAWRGKFMAFTQQGTTLHGDGIHPTCLNYLKRLGVKYVQLMPIFDFGSVDEAKPLLRQYNWGYDPTNYNVPEGSYSTDPARGEVRIRECREMIAALHAAGIGVVMDVVYNHMYRNENPLNDTVPCYFFRQNEDGSFSNGSGCGNEFASERPMARRYMIDSILYWAQEYHIDGFRFDLMGLYDVETINAVRAALDTLPGGRDILMYGEPWQGGGSQLHRYEANKANLAMLNDRIGIFCDDTRDTIKGGCFNAREPGYVEGRPGSFWDIGGAVAAWWRSDRLPPHAPSQIVNYVSAHDNFTLWDKLLLVRYEKPEFTAADGTALAQNRLAAGIYLTSFTLCLNLSCGRGAPRAQPDRELCFRPRQLHPVGQAAAGAVRKAGVHGGRQHSPCPEPAGGGHLPDQLRPAFPAGGRGVCPHQKREGQQLPLFACAEPAGLGAGRKIPCAGGLLPRPAGAAGKVSAAFQHRPPRAGCPVLFLTGAAAGGLAAARPVGRRRSMAGAVRVL